MGGHGQSNGAIVFVAGFGPGFNPGQVAKKPAGASRRASCLNDSGGLRGLRHQNRANPGSGIGFIDALYRRNLTGQPLQRRFV